MYQNVDRVVDARYTGLTTTASPSLWRDGESRHATRTSAPRPCAPIVQTLRKARRGVGVSREPAKLDRQDNSPRLGEGQTAGNGG